MGSGTKRFYCTGTCPRPPASAMSLVLHGHHFQTTTDKLCSGLGTRQAFSRNRAKYVCHQETNCKHLPWMKKSKLSSKRESFRKPTPATNSWPGPQYGETFPRSAVALHRCLIPHREMHQQVEDGSAVISEQPEARAGETHNVRDQRLDFSGTE